MIERLELNNFKSWKAAQVDFGLLTGFFGTNSSGKSSLLQFLLLLKQTVESYDRNQVLELGDDKSYIELGAFDDVVFNHELDLPISFNVHLRLPSVLSLELDALNTQSVTRVAFSAAIVQRERLLMAQKFEYSFNGYRIALEAQGVDNQVYALKASQATTGISSFTPQWRNDSVHSSELPKPHKFYGFPEKINLAYTNLGFLKDLQLAFEQVFDSLYYLGPLRDSPKRQYIWQGTRPSDVGRRGEKVVDAILASKNDNAGQQYNNTKLQEKVAFWLKELGLIHSFMVEELAPGNNIYRVLVKKTEYSTEVSLTDVGFGVSQILPVIALCYYVPVGSTILMEQPEIHLHPSVQAGLADVFLDAIKTRGVQIILESHSEHLLKRLQRRMAEASFEPDTAKLYFCSTDKGRSNLSQLQLDAFGNVINWPEHFFGDSMGELAATAKAILKRKVEHGNH